MPPRKTSGKYCYTCPFPGCGEKYYNDECKKAKNSLSSHVFRGDHKNDNSEEGKKLKEIIKHTSSCINGYHPFNNIPKPDTKYVWKCEICDQEYFTDNNHNGKTRLGNHIKRVHKNDDTTTIMKTLSYHCEFETGAHPFNNISPTPKKQSQILRKELCDLMYFQCPLCPSKFYGISGKESLGLHLTKFNAHKNDDTTEAEQILNQPILDNQHPYLIVSDGYDSKKKEFFKGKLYYISPQNQRNIHF